MGAFQTPNETRGIEVVTEAFTGRGIVVIAPHIHQALVEFLVYSERDSSGLELVAAVLHAMRHERIYLLKTSALPGWICALHPVKVRFRDALRQPIAIFFWRASWSVESCL
ncbi:hypothetical protein C5D98_14995 [Rathayibacter rathayi]|uniref:hypothetical protein n=1 Tax=Rathayibacter rathayi TaxID=33887 RepID=UPI000CE73BFB|nr:hypothetical protein [Rathayibacter rathayi]PPG77488.1 hypothetical protein C5C15_09340 [Rathayibacter rathayi]PPG94324.1 hypothetical protein C5C22_09075 [Rathayibacter rathayi]PPI65256.1 hypothetical protein C5D98_14995 [Rathayibacter rathayi]